MNALNPRAIIGSNNPPPLDTWKLHIEDLMHEAQGYLDGEPIANQAQADSIGKLLGMLREARKGADDQRKVEKAPHDAAGKAVQAAWTPLLDRVGMAETVAKRALAPFLEAQEAEQRRIAAEARAEAERIAQEAKAQIQRAADTMDLAGREEAERWLKAADQADKAATRAEKVKPMAAGTGRSVSLTSVWTPELVDPVQALKFYRQHRPEYLKAWLLEQAQADVRSGMREISGFTITETKVAR